MSGVVLGLGANIGECRATIAAAIDRLNAHPEIRVAAVSGLYETPPWGKTDQPAFLNAAVRVDTTLPPRDLLEVVLAIERALGRDRRERWGPRLIDVDILLYGTEEIGDPSLVVPHPHLAERAFALAPLLDVLPQARFAGRAAADWLQQADRSGMRQVALPGWHRPQSADAPRRRGGAADDQPR